MKGTTPGALVENLLRKELDCIIARFGSEREAKLGSSTCSITKKVFGGRRFTALRTRWFAACPTCRYDWLWLDRTATENRSPADAFGTGRAGRTTPAQCAH